MSQGIMNEMATERRGNLILSRRVGEKIDIADGLIEIEVVEFSQGRVKLMLKAPRDISIHRWEVLQRLKAESEPEAERAVEAVP